MSASFGVFYHREPRVFFAFIASPAENSFATDCTDKHRKYKVRHFERSFRRFMLRAICGELRNLLQKNQHLKLISRAFPLRCIWF
jgi:hypothetical protein